MAEQSSSRVPIHLPTYNLGDEGKPNHFNASTSRETAAGEAKSLAVGDAAFIKRSDLKWTYAVVTEKTVGNPMILRFEVDKDKNRKSFPEAQWGKYIRVIHVEKSELVTLQADADKTKQEDAKATQEAAPEDTKPVPSSAASIGGESTVSVKTGKSFFSGMPSIFFSPKKEAMKEAKKEVGAELKHAEVAKKEVAKKEAKKEVGIESKPADVAKKEVEIEPKPVEEAKSNESKAEASGIKEDVAKAIEEVDLKKIKEETIEIETVSSTVASVGGDSTSSRKNKGVFNVLPSIFSSKKEEETKPKPAEAQEDAKSTAELAKEQPKVVVATPATPEETVPEAPEDGPDDTKENSNPGQEAPNDTVSALRSPLSLNKSVSMLNKLGLKKDKDKTPPTPAETTVPFEHSKSTTKNTVKYLGDANPSADDITKKEWFDTEACEVDYDKNPTDLFQALEAREFGYVHSMFKQVSTQFSKECKTWVVARGQKQNLLRFRALPLHAALVFGAPDELVIKILNAYPLATRGRDVKGRLPIHLAMEHNASEEVVALIIETFPKGMLAIDKKNMVPLDYINGNMGRVHMKKYLPLIIAAKVEEERAKWEVELATAIEEHKVSLKSDPEFMKPIVEAVTEKVEYIYAGKLSLVETNHQKEIELMKKKCDSETQALLDGFEVKLNFERKLNKLKGKAK